MPVNIYISGGGGRDRIHYAGKTYTKAELKNLLKKSKVNVFYGGSKPSLKASTRLDFMIAPHGVPSNSSQKILDRHDEAEVVTWNDFVKNHSLQGFGKKDKKKKKKSGGNTRDEDEDEDESEDDDNDDDKTGGDATDDDEDNEDDEDDDAKTGGKTGKGNKKSKAKNKKNTTAGKKNTTASKRKAKNSFISQVFGFPDF